MVKEEVSTPQYSETADIETSSDDYARRFSGEVGQWFLNVQAETTLKMLSEYPNARILDVGGGHGQITETLINNGFKVTVHGSADVCKTRINHFIEQGLCEFKVGDILNLPFADRSFDVVISYRLLPHVEQWRPFLSELARVADKAIILDYPEIRSINYIAPFLFKFKKQLEGNTRPYTCFRKPNLLAAFEQESFSYSDHFAQFFVPMVVHRTVKSTKFSALVERFFQFTRLTNLLGSPVILKMARK